MKFSIAVKSQIQNYFCTLKKKKKTTNHPTILSVPFEILNAINCWLHLGRLSAPGVEMHPVQFQSSAFMTCEVQCENI